MLRGLSDQVTFSFLVIAGIVMAVEQALKDAPKLAAVLPGWVSSSLWNYVPLLFLIAAGIVWTVGWIKRRFKPVPVSEDKSLTTDTAAKLKPERIATAIAVEPKLKIHSALYGVGNDSDIQIADKLNGQKREGLVLAVNNNLVNHPPEGKFRHLAVKYSWDGGEPQTVSIPEDGWLMLPPDAQIQKLHSQVEVAEAKLRQRESRLEQLQRQLDKADRTIAENKAVAKTPQIHVYLNEMAWGLRKYWLDRTFVFLDCTVVSINKSTSVLSISAFVRMSDGSRLRCKVMDSLSEWRYEVSYSGKRSELEELSLWAKLKNEPLEEERKQSGWLGLEVPLSEEVFTKRHPEIAAIDLGVTDAKTVEHVITFSAPWIGHPEKHLIVAKHVTQQ